MSLAEDFVKRMNERKAMSLKWMPQQTAARVEGIGMEIARKRKMFKRVGINLFEYEFSDGSIAMVSSAKGRLHAYLP